jgi:methanogenic corrinoid protein MtbC1
MTNTSDESPAAQSAASLGIQAALLAGDPGMAYGLISELMADGVSFDRVLFEVLAPLQRDVGTRWLRADYRIAEEHAASAAVETVVGLLAGAFDMPEDGLHVVVACAEGDDHSLPARMVAAYLTYVGWRVTFLGATLPAHDLGAYLADEQPAVLLLSCSSTANLAGARACVRASHDAGVPVVAGGQAFGAGPGRARAIGADTWINDPTALEEVTDEGWDVVAAESQALPDDEASSLSEAVPAFVEAAIAAGPLEVSLASARADLRLLGETITAAVLVDDATVLDEFLEWQGQRHRHQNDVLATDELVTRFSAQLPASADRAKEMLAARTDRSA